MKILKTLGILVVVIALAVGGYKLFSQKQAQPKVNYKSEPVLRGKIVNTVTATGTIEPITQVEVGTQVSGIINHIYVDYNSVVKKGEVIAELDRTTLEAEVASSTASLQANKTEYDYQQKNYARIKGLHEKSMVSDTEFEQAEYQYEKAKSNYEKSQSDMTRVRQNLSYATIYSPIDGVVIDRAVEEGQTVASSFNTPTLFTIANDLRQMRVIADVDEADIGEVVKGQRASFTVDAFPDDVFHGAVTQVRLQPTTTSNVVTYEVVVDAPNPDLKLKPGLTANLTICTMEKDSVLKVPLKALRFQPEGHEAPQLDSTDTYARVAWVQTPQGITAKVVHIGSNDGIFVEVKEGLSDNEQILTGIALGGTSADPASAQGEGQSPFMPQRPGQNRNTKK
ncbi:MAG: efflux RND transporter periplasmic adaptor subunit [Alistipes sp.]|nr:efflux RND transporter periplasmic adaptor subunit [Alistipes sp.]